jgi:hypothetical protein
MGGWDAGMGEGGTGKADGGGEMVCAGQAVSLDEVRRREVREGARVEIDATATSQKFLLSHAQSGSCLWGVFVGAAPDGDEPRGVLAVAFGDEASEATNCVAGTDGIPDDIAPGDLVRVFGRYEAYVPGSCGGIAPEPQVVVDARCPIARSGRGDVLSPVTLTLARADELARGTDAELVGRYAGGLVAIERVSGVRAEDGQGVVGPYGVVRFAETALEAHNDVAYGDLSGAGPGGAGKSLIFAESTRFERVVGLFHLDYCTWSLALRDPCGDVVPPSAGCGD